MPGKLKEWTDKNIGDLTWSAHTRLVWGLLVTLSIADAALLPASGLSLESGTLLVPALSIAALLAVTFVYTYYRRDARIASLAHLGATTLAFTAAASILSFITVTWRAPLVDDALVVADKALGLDWVACLDWVTAHKLVHLVLILAYCSFVPQMIVLFVTLNFMGRITRAWEMQWLFMLVCTGSVLLSGIWPAAGAFGYFHVHENDPYVQAFLALRDGSLKTISRDSLQGVVQFPSLHMAWAIIYAYAARGIKYLFPVLLVINVAVFFATPSVGGHHFADLWGGIALTLAAILLVRKMEQKGLLPPDAAKRA